jgi:hypothetical protein
MLVLQTYCIRSVHSHIYASAYFHSLHIFGPAPHPHSLQPATAYHGLMSSSPDTRGCSSMVPFFTVARPQRGTLWAVWLPWPLATHLFLLGRSPVYSLGSRPSESPRKGSVVFAHRRLVFLTSFHSQLPSHFLMIVIISSSSSTCVSPTLCG